MTDEISYKRSFEDSLKKLIETQQPRTGIEKDLIVIDQAIRETYRIGLTAALREFWAGRALAEDEGFNDIVQCIRSLRTLRGPAPVPQSRGNAAPQPDGP